VSPRATLAPALLVPLVAIFACAKPPAPARPAPRSESRSSTIDVEGFVVPRAAEDFSLVQTHPFDQAQLGTQIRYATFYIPAARIDLFLFPVVMPELFTLAAVLHEQYLGMQQEVEQTAALAHGSVTLRAQRLETVPGVSPPLVGIHADYDFVDADQTRLRSHAFLAVRGRHYLKVRFTYAAENADVGEPAYARFLASVVAEVAKSPAGDPVPVATTITRTTMNVSHGNSCVLAAWIAYAAQMTDAIGRGEFADTFERELAVRGKTIEIWAKMKEDGGPRAAVVPCVDPSLDAMLAVQQHGLFAEYVWHYYSKPYWIEPAGLDLAAFAAYERRALARHDPVLQPGVVIDFEDAKR
jgi:hypothetical protein